jgi:hypothetical protein
MVHTDADLQGLYGFMGNDAVDYRALIDEHATQTRRRIDEQAAGRTVLVVHDTTTFTFPGEIHREGMGWVTKTKQGFHAHFSLALSADGTRNPLGVLGVIIDMPPARDPNNPPNKRDGKACAADPDRDTRWRDAVNHTSELLRGHASPIHVMDREGDAYEAFAEMRAKGQRFVVRARVLNRVITTEHDDFKTRTKLRLVAERAIPITAREVQLSRRRKSPLADANKKHPPRDARIAKLEFAAESGIRIPRPKHLPETVAESVDINIVHVRELDTPEGYEPVEWLLVTSEPVETAEDILRVVDIYRARWTIEEYNKAIKTGCAYEKRQLESARALLIALAMCIPIAWQLLALRHLSRHQPDAPATDVLSPERIEVLRAISKRPIPAAPTVYQAFRAIASLGGYIPTKNPPGWQTLRDGMEKLLFAESVWLAARTAIDLSPAGTQEK